MKVITTVCEMAAYADAARLSGKNIAFVPTMGFLHEGHLSLMREGRRRASVLVASIFVNPTQFRPNEDFAKYPRSLKRDCEMMETIPVDAVFAPEPDDMYTPGSQTWVEVTELTRGLCGRVRPDHFRGVTTVVAKLFNVVKPQFALFGEKDFQQLRAIQRMVDDLKFDIEIVPMPIVREADGLAMSSRNACLSETERRQAPAISRALAAGRDKYRRDARSAAEVAEAARRVLEREEAIKIEYVEAVDAETLEAATSAERPLVLAIAARVGATRLIDNVVLRPPPAVSYQQAGLERNETPAT